MNRERNRYRDRPDVVAGIFALLFTSLMVGCRAGDEPSPAAGGASPTSQAVEGLRHAEPERNAAGALEAEASVSESVVVPAASLSVAVADEPVTGGPALDEQLAALEIPPPWLASVATSYDISQPWKEARLEIRRLLSLNQPAAHREAVKLMWIYRQKDDMGDGHEYPMYTFLGGEPLWSVRAHEQYLERPHRETPIHAYISLSSLYARFGAYEKGLACLERAMAGLPAPPWNLMRKADVLAAYGDLYVAWGQPDVAKEYYAQAAELYPTAQPPFGGHLLPRRAAEMQARLDRLTFHSLQDAALKDGRYQDRALGYVGDIHVSVTVRNGKIADIQLKHEEKIDQNACVVIPQRILQQQSLEVDGISGATVTKDAIVNGVYRCLKQAGLR